VEAIKERRWRQLDLPPRLRALCALAEKLSGTPSRMTEGDWRPLCDLGFDDLALLEVAHIVGMFNYLTRLADGFGLRLDEATIRAGKTGVPLRKTEPSRA
jgi:alkylhydroperoxidase family enzyme